MNASNLPERTMIFRVLDRVESELERLEGLSGEPCDELLMLEVRRLRDALRPQSSAQPVRAGEALAERGHATPCACRLPSGCACDAPERALRAVAAGRGAAPLSPAERELCLEKIADVEGYRRADYEFVDDAALAQGVLDAWRDFCLDKGLM